MLGILIAIVGVVAVRDGVDGLLAGLEGSWDLLVRALPVVFLGMALAGFMQTLAPPGIVGKYMGEESGMLGLAIGMGAGMITPGGPYVMYPIGAALMNSGAGLGPMSGYVATRHLITFNRLLVWDLPFLGWPFTVARILVSLWMPFATVILVPIVHRLLPRAIRTQGPRDVRTEAER